MTEKYKKIENLLEDFFDGKTSREEEQVLYDFFREEDIPGHLTEYKEMFGYFELGLAREISLSEDISTPIKPIRQRKGLVKWICGAAAVLLMLLLLSPYFNSHTETDPFEGSYIVRNGERIGDLDLIRPELELTMQIALLRQNQAEQMFEIMENTEDPALAVRQEIEAQYCRIIHQFPDEKVRKEVQQILEIECE